MRVAVRPDRDVVAGVTRVRFTPDLATDRLVFRLWPNAPVLSARGADLSVGEVSTAGAVRETRAPDPTSLEVLLDERLEPGDSVDVRLPWRLQEMPRLDTQLREDLEVLTRTAPVIGAPAATIAGVESQGSGV